MNFLNLPFTAWAEMALLFLFLAATARPVGLYVSAVLSGEKTFLTPALGRIEHLFLRAAGPEARREMTWKRYAGSVLAFAFGGFLVLALILRFQSFPSLPPDQIFNIAISYITNTNFQTFSPELTLTAATQMAGIAVQNFLSAAMGLCVFAVLARSLAASKATEVGNFWRDLVRIVLYILLPLSLLLAVALLSQGVVQTFGQTLDVTMLEAQTPQTLVTGPVASQTAIKLLGSNGGGYYAANAAHPFENPTPLSNFMGLFAICLLPIALPFTFGRMIGKPRQGTMLLAVMLILFVPLLLFCLTAEQTGNPILTALGVTQLHGNLEGKELRFGASNSALWTSLATATANGSTNASIESFMPLASLVPLVFIQLGEVIFGGVGSGLYGMLVYTMLAVFVAGLMIGRTPEYLGKKIGVFEIQMASLVILIPALATLIGTAIAVSLPEGTKAVYAGSHQAFSEILYAFSSTSNNNGSAMGGLVTSTSFYNVILGLCMIAGRFGVILPVLAMAGSLASKTSVPQDPGTLDTTSPLFIFFLVVSIVLVGFLTFVPTLLLGPVAEHLHLMTKAAAL